MEKNLRNVKQAINSLQVQEARKVILRLGSVFTVRGKRKKEQEAEMLKRAEKPAWSPSGTGGDGEPIGTKKEPKHGGKRSTQPTLTSCTE